MIPFNKPYFTGNETFYIEEAVRSGRISGNGNFTKKCHSFFEQRYGFNKCLLTTSCTDALEMAAILLDLKPGDEVIIPAYTFVSTANAFVLRGAKIVFADSKKEHPGIEENSLENLITSKTRVIVPVHYAGVACNMDVIMDLANKYNIYVVEDAAQAIDGFYTGRTGIKKALGSIGHLAAFSFHETKNIIAGEGGMLVVNDKRFEERAEIIWEKGTNRAKFFRGEINKYEWVDVGSSFLPSEIMAAFLWAQLENMEKIQQKRLDLWELYYSSLKGWASSLDIGLPRKPIYSSNNAHMFYLVCKSLDQRIKLISYLKDNNILAVFHYISLNSSPFHLRSNKLKKLKYSDQYTNRLLRLPFYFELEINHVIDVLKKFDE